MQSDKLLMLSAVVIFIILEAYIIPLVFVVFQMKCSFPWLELTKL